MQCPKCNRMLATVPGVSRVQCFGCGTIVDTGAASASTSKKRNGGTKPEGATGTASKAIIAILSIGLGLVLLVGVGTGTYFFLMNRKAASNGLQSAIPTEDASVSNASSDGGAAEVDEELVPAYVATEQERALAGTVSETNRRQIIQMWDQLTATTRKKLLIPKNSYTRNSVENMLGAIERREIQNMSALLQVEQAEINAVIQVEMADRAIRELEALQGSAASGNG